MELYQLAYFEAAARTGSMQAAAAVCHVSQSALSLQVKKLEEEVGLRLFARTPRGVVLTAAGRRVLATGRRLREEVAGLRRDLRRRDFGPRPRLRLGLQPVLASDLVAAPLRAFLAAHPDWRITLAERANERLPDLLLGGQLDVAILTRAGPPAPGLGWRPLFRLRYVAICPAEHPLARRRAVRLAELVRHRLLVFDDPSGLPELIQREAESQGTEASVVLGSDHALTAFELAAEGLGVALVPALMAERARRRGLAAVPVAGARLEATIGAAWRSADAAPEGLDALFAALAAHGARTGGRASAAARRMGLASRGAAGSVGSP